MESDLEIIQAYKATDYDEMVVENFTSGSMKKNT